VRFGEGDAHRKEERPGAGNGSGNDAREACRSGGYRSFGFPRELVARGRTRAQDHRGFDCSVHFAVRQEALTFRSLSLCRLADEDSCSHECASTQIVQSLRGGVASRHLPAGVAVPSHWHALSKMSLMKSVIYVCEIHVYLLCGLCFILILMQASYARTRRGRRNFQSSAVVLSTIAWNFVEMT
jgi:hypothetical protein